MEKLCIKCGVSEHIDEAEFCINCGLPLNNYCTNPHCELNEYDERVACPSNACYCYLCGAETDFFKAGELVTVDYKKKV